MKSVLLIIISAFLSGSINAQTSNMKRVDEIFNEWNKNDTPGCGLGIFQNGKIVYARGYGAANLEYGILNSEHSVFRIASTSKQFTAACIVLLSQEGKLKLSDPLSKFYPEFPSYAKGITVLHLLNHTSGVRDYLTLADVSGIGDDDFYTDAHVEKWLSRQTELNFTPGTEYLYSNSGYWLLAQIVEKVSGENMRNYAEEKLFKPLKMSDTHFHNNTDEVVKNRSVGYYPVNDGYEISQTKLEMIGDGGIFTTISDMKKWDDAFYDQKILDQEFWRIMTKPGVLNNGEELTYACGLGIDKYKGLNKISHGGAFVGYRAEYMKFPDQNFSVVVLANRGDANPTAMSYQVADLFLKDDYQEEEQVSSESNTAMSAAYMSLNKEQLERLTGDYWNDKGSYSRNIYVKDGSLYYFRNIYSETKLNALSENTFEMEGLGNEVQVKFETKDNKANKMIFYQGGLEIAISEYYKKEGYSPEELKSYAGNFYSKELDVHYTLKNEDGKLALYLKGETVGHLEKVKKNLLLFQGGNLIKFDDNGKGFKLNAGRVQNLKFERT